MASINLKAFYTHNAQVYVDIPPDSLSRRDIEELALERLNLFKLIENSTKKGYTRYSNEWTENVLLSMRYRYKDTFYKLCENSSVLSNPSEGELDIRRMDYLSHYILRIGYSTLKESHWWFIEREAEWLYLRYQVQTVDSKQLFLFYNDIDYERISDEDKKQILENLCEDQHEKDGFYKVDFNQAIDLVKDKKVYLKGGYAYVPFPDLIWCIMVRYRLFLEKVLLHTSRTSLILDKIYVDLIKLIQKIINGEIGTAVYKNGDYDNNSNRKITISELNKYSHHNFPLCMTSLYERLKDVNHLKYGGRIQLGNFLKAIGLSLEDSLKFWSTEFTHKMTPTHFEKNYSYNIKHMYGKVGRMKEYMHDRCIDLTRHDIGAGEAHGCPFKMWDTLNLTQKLKQCKVSQSTIDGIIRDTLNKQYQKACCKYFKAVHNVSQDITIDSPVQYFDQSRNMFKQREEPYEIDSDVSEDEIVNR